MYLLNSQRQIMKQAREKRQAHTEKQSKTRQPMSFGQQPLN
jgi:hypothetical protein